MIIRRPQKADDALYHGFPDCDQRFLRTTYSSEYLYLLKDSSNPHPLIPNGVYVAIVEVIVAKLEDLHREKLFLWIPQMTDQDQVVFAVVDGIYQGRKTDMVLFTEIEWSTPIKATLPKRRGRPPAIPQVGRRTGEESQPTPRSASTIKKKTKRIPPSINRTHSPQNPL